MARKQRKTEICIDDIQTPINNIRELRLDQGMTSQQLADAVHVAKSTISEWENGSWAGQHRKELAEALGVYPAHIWFVDPHREREIHDVKAMGMFCKNAGLSRDRLETLAKSSTLLASKAGEKVLDRASAEEIVAFLKSYPKLMSQLNRLWNSSTLLAQRLDARHDSSPKGSTSLTVEINGKKEEYTPPKNRIRCYESNVDLDLYLANQEQIAWLLDRINLANLYFARFSRLSENEREFLWAYFHGYCPKKLLKELYGYSRVDDKVVTLICQAFKNR